MPSSENNNKKIQITSKLDVESECLHEKVVDHDTGQVKITDKHEPHYSSLKTTVASNPVKYEAKGVEEPHVTEGEAVDLNPATVGCDTSQL